MLSESGGPNTSGRSRAATYARRIGIGAALWFAGIAIASCSLAVDADALNAGCPSGTKSCNGECVSTSDPENGCGRPGCQPCALDNARSVCSPTGECVVGVCLGSFENCNLVQSDGCEIDVRTATNHCGSCTAAPCTPQNAEPDCANGRCAYISCHTGFRDCDQRADNGCEINITNDPAHCGACNMPCAAGQTCSSGSCS